MSLAVLAWQRWHGWGPSAVAEIRTRAAAVSAWLVEPSNLLLLAILSAAVIARYLHVRSWPVNAMEPGERREELVLLIVDVAREVLVARSTCVGTLRPR